jgi:hypothetical protein
MIGSMESHEDVKNREQIKNINLEQIPSLEEQANYKGNYTELLFSRLKNPVIKNQLLDLLEKNEKWLEEHPPTVSTAKKDEKGEVFYDSLDLPVFESTQGTYTPKSREQLSKDIEDAMEKEMSVTNIDFDRPIDESSSSIQEQPISGESVNDFVNKDISDPKNRTVYIGMKRENLDPLTESEIQERSLIEAHEKGHVFRFMKRSDFLGRKFSSAFDSTKVTPSSFYGKHPVPEGATDEDVIKVAKEYLFDFESPQELIERMSQLKGYFGMKGDEKFTIKHLEYAREHYIEDVKLDNHMQAFFDAITPEKEFAFLTLINSSGV